MTNFDKKREMTEDLNALSYCVGMSIAGSLIQQNLQEITPAIMAEAIDDVFKGNEPKFSADEANAIIQRYLQYASEAKFSKNKEEGANFLNTNKEKSGVHVTPSGLQYEVLVEGSGPKPTASDSVTVHYHGTLIDGLVFDSSVKRGEPATFGVNQVISGWTEALQLMNVGSKYKLYIPENLAYGANPHPGGPIEPYSALIFEVELLAIR